MKKDPLVKEGWSLSEAKGHSKIPCREEKAEEREAKKSAVLNCLLSLKF